MARFFSNLTFGLSLMISAASYTPALANESDASIASPDLALTLAQTGDLSRPESLLVIGVTKDRIEAINVSEHFGQFPVEPLDLVAHVGYGALAGLVQDKTIPHRQFDKADLILSPMLSADHVAAGTNYAAHGEEAGIDTVFLFPKYSKPQSAPVTLTWQEDVMLDYEVEMCVRFQQDVDSMAVFEKSLKAFSICGDFTDRAKMLRNLDVSNLASGRGFTDGKSGENRLPVGVFSIVPRDWRDFIEKAEIGLDVNGERRQQTKTKDMIKPLEVIVEETLANVGIKQWRFNGQAVPLTKTNAIKRGQLVLTGTPEGVTYNAPTLGEKIWGGFHWAASFSFLDHSAVTHILERQIVRGLDSKAYLQRGDQVTLYSNFLGSTLVLIK